MSRKNQFGYSQKATTQICYEKPSEDNPYIAESTHLFGYDLIELATKKSFVEVLLLLNTGELPSPEASVLMNTLMVGLINPGPRNSAVRAAMNAGVSKTNTSHILPIGLMVLGGEHNGSIEVEKAMHFIQQHQQQPIEQTLSLINQSTRPREGDFHPIPGIGTKFGDKDLVCCDLAKHIATLDGVGQSFKWVEQVIASIQQTDIGWLVSGLTAAVLLDLGIQPREGGALFQLLCSPGILAHGLEQTHLPVTSMPFMEDRQYDYQP